MKKNLTKLRVRYGETDQMGVVYHGNYLQYLEEGRTEWLRQLGITYKWMEDNGVHLPVIDARLKYKRPAYYDDVLSITTKIQKIPTYRIEFDYEIHNQNGELLVEASTTLVFMNSETKKPMKAPSYILEMLS